MSLSNSLKSLSHHAYCLIGNDSTRAELLSTLEKKNKIKVHGNPDFFDRVYETFTIDDARGIKSLAETKPMVSSSASNKYANDSGAGKKIFVLTTNGITVEAQNAMLKLLEEPPEYAHFFLIVPSAYLLLPTVKSRLSMIGEHDGGQGALSHSIAIGESDAALMKEAESFLKAPTTKRLEMVKSLMDSITKEKKTKQDAVDLINAIEAATYSKIDGISGLKKSAQSLEAIAIARKYMNDRAPSMKMLLEYVALNI